MKTVSKFLVCTALLFLSASTYAQSGDDRATEAEALKISAIEALIAAPAERALPIVSKVLRGNDSNEVKERALFILSQISRPEAHALLGEIARSSNGDLQEEAIRMIGISGEADLLAGLRDIYRDGDEDVRDAVLEAYLIADDTESVLQIAQKTTDAEEFENAVETLGAMGAIDKLRTLRDREDMYESLIEAYAVAGDVESLREIALDGSNKERQAEALEGLAITGDPAARTLFMQIYRDSTDEDVKEAALEAMLISDYDEGVLELFRESTDAGDKQELLQVLVMMNSDAVWDLIDATLENGQ